MSKQRYHTLDSIRGIASLQVIIAHCLVAVPAFTWIVFPDNSSIPHTYKFYIGNSPLHFFWSDSAAVKVFFVLSGFVLSLPYFSEDNNRPSYSSFFVKRIIRLSLPCFAIIAISLGFKYLLYKPNEVTMFSGWVQSVWTDKLSRMDWVHIILLNYNFDFIDRSLWTIPPEIKLSLILPIFVLLFKRINAFVVICFILLYIITWHYFNKHGAREAWIDFPVLFYLTFFLIGACMAKYRYKVTSWINDLSKTNFFIFVIFTLLIYTSSYSFWWLPSKLLHVVLLASDYIAAFGAIMILTLALSKRCEVFFTSKFLLFIGKISFSIYLVHAVVVTVAAYLLRGLLAPQFVVLIAFLSSFGIAVIFYNYVEIPSLKLANYISSYFKKIINK